MLNGDWLAFAEVECLHAALRGKCKVSKAAFLVPTAFSARPRKNGRRNFLAVENGSFSAWGERGGLPVAKLADNDQIRSWPDNDQISPESVPSLPACPWLRICSICVRAALSHYRTQGRPYENFNREWGGMKFQILHATDWKYWLSLSLRMSLFCHDFRLSFVRSVQFSQGSQGARISITTSRVWLFHCHYWPVETVLTNTILDQHSFENTILKKLVSVCMLALGEAVIAKSEFWHSKYLI